MQDDSPLNPDDVTCDMSGPNAETCHDESASHDWLDSNVGVHADEWIGKRVGDFDIIRIIGIGGMGYVYEAKQIHPHRSVALKIVKSAAATPATLHRFELESELLARLQHPGIAQVYDSGHQTQEDVLLPYFAMEYVPGSRSITDYAEEEKLTRAARLRLFLDVCEAVQYGHGRGIIHRDLKPSNILITSNGKPKVIDFGVALMAGSDDVERTVTVAGRFVGTLQWSSPEQCGDDPHDVDVRTDVYSLGVLMFQLMTGELPYELKGIPLYRAPLVIRETKPTPPKSIDESIPDEISQILMKSLSKDRESRYESVVDLAKDIQRFLNSQPILAKPPTALHRLRLYARRNQLKFRAAIVVFFALLLGLTGLIWGLVESEARQKDMKRTLVIEEQARTDAEQKAYIATIGTAQAAIANNAWGMARHQLKSTDRNQRGWEWNYLHGIVNQSNRTWLIGDRPTSLVSSPLGQHIAITFEGERVTLMDELRGVTRDVTLPHKLNVVDFSAEGDVLFLGMANGNIAILDLKLDSMKMYAGNRGPVTSISTLNSNSFATGHPDGSVHIWGAQGNHMKEIQGKGGMVLALDFDYQTNLLAMGSIDGTVQVWDVEKTEPMMRAHGHGGGVRSVHFANGGSLFSGGDDGKIVVWNVPDGSHRIVNTEHGEVMALSSVDEVVASVGSDGAVRLWSIDKLELLDTLIGHDDLIWSIDALGDTRFITVGKDGSVRWWNASPSFPDVHKVSSKMPASDISFVSNDLLVVASEFDSDLQVVNVTESRNDVIDSKYAEITTVGYFPHLSFAVTGDLDGNVRLWDVEKMNQQELVGSCKGQITALDISPKGVRVAATTLNGQVCVFDAMTQQTLFNTSVSDSIVLAVSLNTDGSELFVSTINGSLTAFHVDSGTVIWKRMGSGSDIIAMEFLASRNALITARVSKTLQLLDAKDGEVLSSRETMGGVLRDIALFNDELRFVTASSDGTVGVWDTATFNLIASLPSKQSLECISVSEDGNLLVVGGGDSSIKLMNGKPYELKKDE